MLILTIINSDHKIGGFTEVTEVKNNLETLWYFCIFSISLKLVQNNSFFFKVGHEIRGVARKTIIFLKMSIYGIPARLLGPMLDTFSYFISSLK